LSRPTPRATRSAHSPYTTLFRSTGNFESLSADAHADLGIRPQEKSTDLNKGIKDIKDAASSDGRLFIDKPQTFSDFNLIYGIAGDRKSTRLNSSHVSISYAVFCL